MSDFAEGESRNLLSKLRKPQGLVFAGLMVFAAFLALSPLIRSSLIPTDGHTAEDVSLAIPVVTSKSGRHEGFGFVVCATVYNEGGPGTVVAGAMVCYEKFSGLGHSRFEQSGTVFLGANESRDVVFAFPEVVTAPCGNRHTIVWAVWARAP